MSFITTVCLISALGFSFSAIYWVAKAYEDNRKNLVYQEFREWRCQQQQAWKVTCPRRKSEFNIDIPVFRKGITHDS